MCESLQPLTLSPAVQPFSPYHRRHPIHQQQLLYPACPNLRQVEAPDFQSGERRLSGAAEGRALSASNVAAADRGGRFCSDSNSLGGGSFSSHVHGKTKRASAPEESPSRLL